MRLIGITWMMLSLSVGSVSARASELSLKPDTSTVSDSEFRARLTAMLGKVESSIQALRNQIAESQSAPFLSDLYLQLAELLSQKSNALYYVQMEKTGGEKQEGGFTSVVAAQKESIAVYEKILKEFPATDKRAQIRYRMALALKSIDEIPAFEKIAAEVVHDYPGSDEAVRSELLLGQYYFEQHDYPAAMTRFTHVAASSFIFERDLARYRMGLIQLANERYQEALDHFEQVITDSALHEQDNPYSVSLQSKTLKSDLKREALVDSVRAYTQLHGKGGDPVGYYSRIAPSEIHFQEVIEKLAIRYVYLKNYDSAVKLLRSLSERSADPQRVVNIYRDVLVMIPIGERANIPVGEMRFVLDQYHRWTSYFDVAANTRKDAQDFFEKQIRELGTRNHTIAKEKKDSKDAALYLARARDYYLLYLGAFDSYPDTPKMAANLADVYFAEKDWVHSGEYYLRTYAGEFGSPDGQQKDQLMDNAILCLQKDPGDSFYETVRRRGLLIRALDNYIASSDKRMRDPGLAFLRAKTRFEQGVFPQALVELFDVAKRFSREPQAALAGEIILDYFNVRNDFDGLGLWSGKLLALGLSDRVFGQKLASIQTQANSKILQDRVKKVPGYDEFSQGRSYLQAALSSSDASLSEEALKEALARSKEERDIQTYLRTASILGEREKDPAKKAEILESVAQENRKIGSYYGTLDALEKIYKGSAVPVAKRESSYEQAVQTAVSMRDWVKVGELSQSAIWKRLSAQTLAQVKQGWSELLESPIQIPSAAAERLALVDSSHEGLLAAYKAREKLPSAIQTQINQAVESQCQERDHSTVCRWKELSTLDFDSSKFRAQLQQAPLTLADVQKSAPTFSSVLRRYQDLSGAGDTQLEIALQLRIEELYETFSAYLHRVAGANAEFSRVLLTKAGDSDKAAQAAQKICRGLTDSSGRFGSDFQFCTQGHAPSVVDLLHWGGLKNDQSPTRDLSEESVVSLQKKIFSSKESAESEAALSKEFLARKDYHHAIALAAQGLSRNPAMAGEFKTVLGCSALGLGYMQEAAYHLQISRPDEMKQKCGALQ